MADIRAFRAFRYDLGSVGTLGDVVAPPYDVIDSGFQQQLYDRSPFNVIRLILNREEAGDNEHNNRYIRAARFLKDWQQDEVLVQDSARSVYVYHQEFEVEGQRHIRKGFLARVRLEPFGQGKVYPHEETMPGPKADRLKLFHAAGMNLSPIFSLYPDAEGAVQEEMEKAVGRALPLEATDHLGVIHRLWPVTDDHAVSAITGLMGPKPIFIADGHHRYETSLKYLEEKQAAGEVRDDDSPANFTLMMLVSMSDPGCIILPTHRLVSGLPDLTGERLQQLLEEHFALEKIGQGDQAATDTWELIQADAGQLVMGFGSVADGAWYLARYRGGTSLIQQLAPSHSEAWAGLAVSILHVLVLDHLIPKKLGSQAQCRYVHLVSEVNDAMKARQCQLAALVPPAGMDHVEEIAGNLEKMPPKSTYFYPKLLSGLVFNSLKGN